MSENEELMDINCLLQKMQFPKQELNVCTVVTAG